MTHWRDEQIGVGVTRCPPGEGQTRKTAPIENTTQILWTMSAEHPAVIFNGNVATQTDAAQFR